MNKYIKQGRYEAYGDNMISVKIGDCRQLITELYDNSIDCVMTSPPYWGLRDYGHPDQIGLEKTPEEYLNKLLNFFDDVKLKLKDVGNCFVNLGDTYFHETKGSGGSADNQDICQAECQHFKTLKVKSEKVKPKCLCMIPQRFAWNMIEHGWILRNEIIWEKPNHMPESVTDRLTKSHEVIYHFVKQGKYYYDLDAIRAPFISSEKERNRQKRLENPDNKYTILTGQKAYSGGVGYSDKGKNPGDVWSIATQPYPESHFAVFPLELVRKPILAGCPVNGTVLDPFGGSGTVGEFCRNNDRNAILFELNPEYKKLIEERAMLNIKELIYF